MKTTVHSSKTVTPDYGGRSPPSRTEAVTLSVFDKVTFDQYVSGIYFFHAPVPPNDVMEAGFAKALAAYRVWAGRLVGADAATSDRPAAILLNDAGALFVEATTDVALDSVMPLEPTPAVARLHPSRHNVVEPLRVQVTRFMCGSVAVGTTEYHRVGDGRTIVDFMVAWGKATRGLAVDPVPVLDRETVFVPRQPPHVEFEHRGVEFKQPHARGSCSNIDDAREEVVVHRVHFSREWMSDLKSRASAGAPLQYSTVQCVVAHLWRCVTEARGLDCREATAVRIAVNGRSRMIHPRVPEGYAGNVVLWATPRSTSGELASRPLSHAAELVSDAVARMDERYFRSFIDFASSAAVEEERLVPTSDAAKMMLSPDMEVYSMIGFPLSAVDFGGGGVAPVNRRRSPAT